MFKFLHQVWRADVGTWTRIFPTPLNATTTRASNLSMHMINVSQQSWYVWVESSCSQILMKLADYCRTDPSWQMKCKDCIKQSLSSLRQSNSNANSNSTLNDSSRVSRIAPKNFFQEERRKREILISTTNEQNLFSFVACKGQKHFKDFLKDFKTLLPNNSLAV